MTFVVAEIGINWDGDYELAYEMISKSKECGCNAVKFQSFDKNIVKDHPESARLINSSISEKNIEKIDDLAKDVGIEWFATPMYLKAVEILEPFVEKYKIRFSDGKDIVNNQSSALIQKILETNKQLIISSQISPKSSEHFSDSNIKWLYCVPKYPCDFEDLDFSYLSDFNGYSNHCRNILAPLTASILGSEIIEIHITSDLNKNFIDNPVSFNYIELKELVTKIRNVEKIKR